MRGLVDEIPSPPTPPPPMSLTWWQTSLTILIRKSLENNQPVIIPHPCTNSILNFRVEVCDFLVVKQQK